MREGAIPQKLFAVSGLGAVKFNCRFGDRRGASAMSDAETSFRKF